MNRKMLRVQQYRRCIEIQPMWNLICKIIQIIIGATGIVTKGLRKNLENITGKYLVDSQQMTAIIKT
jgi:hypothetical protein